MLRVARLLATIARPRRPRRRRRRRPRVVSINLCTDQLAMLLARPGQLVAVSRVAADPVASAVWREAAAYPAVPADAEAIHRLAPDLVLAGAYDPPATLALARRLGLRVETFGLDASFADIRASVTRMGALLGNAAGAAAPPRRDGPGARRRRRRRARARAPPSTTPTATRPAPARSRTKS